jgi:tRNA A-37 threonylcarbamoyl transferase component Bud32/tetratricopeptide (TPR) repeat protein
VLEPEAMSFRAVPGTRIGDYVVVSEIGRGGMAIVYLAEHPNLGRKVALKLLSDKLSDDDRFRDRFMREARIAAGIEHPNIVPVHDAGEFEGLLFIAMRYVEGIDLGMLLEREGSLPLARTKRVVSQIGAALDAAHAKGLVHRDVKPSNVLLASGEGPGGEDHVYLADFGLARPQIGSDLTKAGELYGTLDYMAPEQFDGRPLDARTDVYALACVAYECLTGEAPFRRESSLAKAAAHLKTRPVAPSERNAELSKEIDEAILRGLAKDKSNRYEHAGQLAAALVEALEGDSPPAAVSTTPMGSELTASIVPHEERKVVTVLACVLKPAAAMDPEDWRVMLSRTTAQVIREIERFGGTALGSMAGTTTGVFGVPAVHEDDAERAVRAALRILEEVAEPMDPPLAGTEVRVGISTGEALVTLGAGDGEGPVAGSAIGDAARLGGEASQGQVVVDRETWGLTSAAVVYEPLPEVTGHDRSEPVPLWRAIHLISRIGTGERDRTPLVGRDPELSMLTQLFDRARERAATEFVTIVAEPGLGKSRLVRELARHVDALPELIIWRQGRCLPYGDGITFWALGEIVKAHAGILETDGAEDAIVKLEAIVDGDDPDAPWLRMRLRPLVGVEAPTAEREENFAAWRRFLESLAERNPTVLVFEDLHWADDALLAFLEHVADYAGGVPLLLVGTARPELYERAATWGGGKRNAATINLTPLSDDETARLVSNLLEQTLLPAEVQSAIVERSGGNPLYAEEFVRLLKDRGVLRKVGATWNLDPQAEIPMPSSVQGLIAARLDTLLPDRKQLLQDASVIGKVFWAGALAAMGDRDLAEVTEALHELSRKELVRPAKRSSMEGESEYAFWHAFVRDVAYGQIPRADRIDKHLWAATWIEEQAGDRLIEMADLLAQHHRSALQLAESLDRRDQVPALRSATVRDLMLAGDRAMGLDLTQAERSYRDALELSAEGGDSAGVLLLRYAKVLYQRGDLAAARQRFVGALERVRGEGDPFLIGEALNGLYLATYYTGEDEAGPSYLAESVALLEPLGPSRALASALAFTAGDCQQKGAFGDSIDWANRAIEVAQLAGAEDEAAAAMGLRGVSRCRAGDADGIEDQRDALAALEHLGAWHLALLVSYNLSNTLSVWEGPKVAAAFIRGAVAAVTRRGLDVDELSSPLRESLFPLGEWDELITNADGVIERGLARGSRWDVAIARLSKARVLLLRGEASAGGELVELASADAIALDVLSIREEALMLRAAHAELTQDAEALRRFVREDLELRSSLADAIDVPMLVRFCLAIGEGAGAASIVESLPDASPVQRCEAGSARALLTESEGSLEKAADLFEKAAQRWAMYPNVFEHAQALLGLGRCLLQQGQVAASFPLREARDVFASLGTKPACAETDALLERAIGRSS